MLCFTRRAHWPQAPSSVHSCGHMGCRSPTARALASAAAATFEPARRAQGAGSSSLKMTSSGRGGSPTMRRRARPFPNSVPNHCSGARTCGTRARRSRSRSRRDDADRRRRSCSGSWRRSGRSDAREAQSRSRFRPDGRLQLTDSMCRRTAHRDGPGVEAQVRNVRALAECIRHWPYDCFLLEHEERYRGNGRPLHVPRWLLRAGGRTGGGGR